MPVTIPRFANGRGCESERCGAREDHHLFHASIPIPDELNMS
jgi:hypothetical protein